MFVLVKTILKRCIGCGISNICGYGCGFCILISADIGCRYNIFIVLGLWRWVSATDDEENSENYAIIKLMNEWKCN